jgi:hypothetical protein
MMNESPALTGGERVGSPGDGGLAAASGPPAGPLNTGLALQEMVEDLSVEDFRIEDHRFERDARLGRELLFLLSNNDWARRTTEVIDVERVRAVDAAIVVDVDLALIRHEAFQPAQDLVRLPVLALPADRPTGRPADGPPGNGRRRRVGDVGRDVPDPITSLEVRDAAGSRVTKVPQADVHHWLAAVLAETLLRQLRRPVPAAVVNAVGNEPARPEPPGNGSAGNTAAAPAGGVDPRDQVVLLAASIRRMLQGTVGGADIDDLVRRPSSRDGSSPGAGGLRRFEGRAQVARAALLDAFRADLDGRRPVLGSRVVEMLDSLIGTVLVVVPISLGTPPTSFTIRLPSRQLVRRQMSRWRLRPQGRLQVDLVVPTSHADRLIRLNLPSGVTWAASPDQGRPGVARVEVLSPLPFDQLRTLTAQLVGSGEDRITWVDRRIAELAVEKLDACLESLRFYELGRGRDRPLASRLLVLRELLRDVAGSRRPKTGPPVTPEVAAAPREELRRAWSDGEWLPRRLLRRLVVNVASPDAVQVRSPAIEDFSLRSEPTGARLDLDVCVVDSTVVDSARDTNAINLFLLTVVTALLFWHHAFGAVQTQVEVLATVLTLFPAIQASRIDRPDVTTLSGLLTRPGYWLNLVSSVPATLLAATIAILPEGTARYPAVGAVAVQLVLHLLIVRRVTGRGAGGWSRRGGDGRRRRPPQAGFVLGTHHAPDHRRFDVIRSTWCRTLSAEALKFGRPVQASIVLGPDRPGSLTDLLQSTRRGDPQVNVLAVFGAAAAGYALTMVVTRGGTGPARLSVGPALVRPVPVDLGQLVPPDPPEWIVEVLIGIPDAEAADLAPESHPVVEIVAAAQANNYRTLLVQYPCGPPPDDRAGCRWMRVRVGVPYRRNDSLNGLRRFLAVLRDLRVSQYQMTVQIVPEMATQGANETAPEETFQGIGGRAETRPLRRDEVEVEGLGEGVWRPIALCADAGVAVVGESLKSLARLRPGMRLAAMSSAVVHGMSVTFLLCHDPDPAEPAPLGLLVAQDLAATDQLTIPVDGRPMPPPQTRGRLAGRLPSLRAEPPSRPGPLLLVQVRVTDRPGVLQELLAQFEHAVRAEAERLGLRPQALDVWNVLLRVIDGRTFQGRMTLRLPGEARSGSADGGWDGVDWAAVVRRLHETQAVDDTAVLRMGLLRAGEGT